MYPWKHIAQHYMIAEKSKLLFKAPHFQGKIPGVMNITASDADTSHLQQSVATGCYGVPWWDRDLQDLLMSGWDDCERGISSWLQIVPNHRSEHGWASHHCSGTTFGRDCSKHLQLHWGLKHSAVTHQVRLNILAKKSCVCFLQLPYSTLLELPLVLFFPLDVGRVKKKH